MTHKHLNTKHGHEIVRDSGPWQIFIYDRTLSRHLEHANNTDDTSALTHFGTEEQLHDLLDFYAAKYPDTKRYHIRASRMDSCYIRTTIKQLPPSKRIRAVKKEHA